jgi:F0F1-type ATP synthase assembly protein I
MAKRIFITTEECQRCSSGLKDDLKTIKNALLGEDLNSGLVHQVTELTSTVKNITADKCKEDEEAEKRKERAQRWKLAAFTVAAALIGILLGRLLELI